uniref:Insulin-degrading enzyme n=1 Tax=Plectus sambesii TaxID=2011161 RepID=A0A914XIB4_9BILA
MHRLFGRSCALWSAVIIDSSRPQSLSRGSLFVRLSSSVAATSPIMRAPDSIVKARYENIIKSAEDKRLYRGLELHNGLRVILVSDPTTDKSAASLDVSVGHLNDPWELPGLAHFCEHMLFLGTEKYPSENEYSKFISAHGGMSNAFTAADHTNYHFDIAPEHLHGALDRFAQFFLSPQFTESATEREVMAVDSENSNNLQNDAWRLIQLERTMSDPKHDYSKFGTGNKTTLLEDAKAKGMEPRTELLKFHKQFYCSNIMGLCIIGNQSLDEMESEMVAKMFVDIENKKSTRKKWETHPYGKDQLGHRLEVVPVKDLRNLSISFPLPDLDPYYRAQPGHYISHILGHEGPGSLLSELKRRGWVSSLSAGARHVANGFAFFNVDVDLSEEGLKNVEEIVLLTFQTIGMISRAKPQEWVHRELQQLSELKFRFKDKEKPENYATSLSHRLHEYPFEDLLYAPFRMDEYRPDLIEMVFDRLNPDNMNYCVISKEFAGRPENEFEKWYGTEYRKIKLDGSFLAKCSDALKTESPVLRMPERNEYIASNFELKARVKDDSKGPELLRDDQFTRVWFKQDQEFLLPKCCSYLTLTSPLVTVDPLRTFLSAMYIYCLQDAMTEETYNPELAGLHHAIDNSNFGLNVRVWGYDEKQRLFVKHLIERLATFVPDQGRFDVLKENFIRSIRNFKQDQPYAQAVFYTSLLLSERLWSKEQLLSVADGVSLDSLKRFIPEMLSALHIEALVHGNVTKEDALGLVDDALAALKSARPVRPLFPAEMKHDREHKLIEGDQFVYEQTNTTHPNSALEVLLQTGVQETRENMLLELLTQIMAEPAFNKLRTNEQLGYIVFSGARRANGAQGLRVIVQGEKDPNYVAARIEIFLKGMREEIEQMPAEEFVKNVEALATKRLEKPKKLTAQAGRYWSEIGCRMYHFNREEEEVADLRKISKEDLLAYFDRVIAMNAPERKKLTVMVYSHTCKRDPDAIQTALSELHVDDATKLTPKQVKSVSQFKDELPLYPLPKPAIDLLPAGALNDNDAIKSML